jgi:DNA-binding transcriptional LysR family regulator
MRRRTFPRNLDHRIVVFQRTSKCGNLRHQLFGCFGIQSRGGQDGELTWEIVYTSPSLTGVRAAALAGLAITPLPASAVIAGLRILDAEEGLPRLPDLEFYEKARSNKAAAALAAALMALAQGPSRPTI